MKRTGNANVTYAVPVLGTRVELVFKVHDITVAWTKVHRQEQRIQSIHCAAIRIGGAVRRIFDKRIFADAALFNKRQNKYLPAQTALSTRGPTSFWVENKQASRRQRFSRWLVVQAGKRDVLQIVHTLRAPRSFAGRLDGG